MSGLGLFLSLLVSGDAVQTLPLPSEEMDGVLVRSSDGRQVYLFLPRNGSFELRALPPLPSPIVSMALVDADDDRDLDLAMLLRDRTVVLWDGDGKGEFVSHERPDAHAHAHHGVLVPALDPAQESALRTLLQDRLARRDPPLVTSASTVSGRFSPGGVEHLAVVEAGERPRLVLVPVDGTEPQVVRTPNAIHTVFVGQNGSLFAPDELNIATGDTVHWVWSSLGHNVVSGSNCTNDNLFCSPSNTNCGANATSNTGATYDRVFNAAGTFPYFCRPHCLLGMTGTVFVGTAPGGILEATNLRLGKAGTSTVFTYTPACGATSHAIYFGEGRLDTLEWVDSICTGTTGSHTVDIGAPSGLQFFVVVGQTAVAEGSYGTNSADAERPEAVLVGACDRSQQISTNCP